VNYPTAFHIGFIQAREEERVNEINERLLKDGYEVAKPAPLRLVDFLWQRRRGGFMIVSSELLISTRDFRRAKRGNHMVNDLQT
jgi:hypothetical protein